MCWTEDHDPPGLVHQSTRRSSPVRSPPRLLSPCSAPSWHRVCACFRLSDCRV